MINSVGFIHLFIILVAHKKNSLEKQDLPPSLLPLPYDAKYYFMIEEVVSLEAIGLEREQAKKVNFFSFLLLQKASETWLSISTRERQKYITLAQQAKDWYLKELASLESRGFYIDHCDTIHYKHSAPKEPISELKSDEDQLMESDNDCDADDNSDMTFNVRGSCDDDNCDQQQRHTTPNFNEREASSSVQESCMEIPEFNSQK